MSYGDQPNPDLPRTRDEWSALIRRLRVQPSKGLGQNFLCDSDVVQRIVGSSGIGAGDTVIEVGPGLGILTAALVATGAEVIAIELDRVLAQHIRVTFADVSNLTLIEGDALIVDPFNGNPKHDGFSLVANLPYSSGTAIMMRFLELARPPASMTVMVQSEVADRLTAKPPGMSVLGVATALLADSESLFEVLPNCFLPPPKVNSTVVRLTSVGEERLPAARRPEFFQLVNAGFRHKRKTLVNSLEMETDLNKPGAVRLVESVGIDPIRRAQTLSLNEWLALYELWRAESAA